MATRINIMKLLQEMRGFAEIGNRRPQPRTPGLFLMQLRSQAFRTALSKRKRTIAINVVDRPGIPDPVKIIHVKGTGHPPATPPSS